MDVLTISRYVVNKSIEKGYAISNLKLQKLLYYIQAMSISQGGNKVFEENIINWKYGPVVVEAYEEFKIYGRELINKKIESYSKLIYKDRLCMELKVFNEEIIPLEQREIIERVIDSYKDVSANKLVVKTHKEGPWRNTNLNDIISTESMELYYKMYPKKLLV